jgi:protease YdgD
VLTLDTALGTADRVLPLAREMPPAGTPIMLGGYEQDRAEIMVADVACRILGIVKADTALLLHHSCAATRGASGAPLLAQMPGVGWSVVGVAAIAGLDAAGGYAVPASMITARSGLLP